MTWDSDDYVKVYKWKTYNWEPNTWMWQYTAPGEYWEADMNHEGYSDLIRHNLRFIGTYMYTFQGSEP